jgi:hypothetical protein
MLPAPDTPKRKRTVKKTGINNQDRPLAEPVPEGAPPCPWNHPTFIALTEKQRAFVRAYLTSANRVGSLAWRMAGLSATAANVRASQMLSTHSVKICIEAIDDLVAPWERFKLLQEAAAAKDPSKPVAPPPAPLTREGLITVMAALAEGRDPRWRDMQQERELGQMFPMVIRAADMVAAGKFWAELMGEYKRTHVLEGNPDKPITIAKEDYSRLSDSEIEARLATLRSRNAVTVPALQAAPIPQPTAVQVIAEAVIEDEEGAGDDD